VYLFIDRDGTVVYVGKAKNLRSRVRSYFYGDSRRTVDQMLRDLRTIEHRVCDTELEAEVTELRLIAAHVPRYNRRGRPPRSPHWVKLTDERFPRLSMVRAMRGDGRLYLGPFRSRRAAEVVVHAIWDAIPIRRCNGRGNKRSAACSFSQLGVAMCPCDGSVSDARYAEVVQRLHTGVTAEPAVILEPLRTRMLELAGDRRFEEAADARDRYRSLATALERRRVWQALQAAGLLWAEDRDGQGALVERGRLVSSWRAGGSPPLTPAIVEADSAGTVPGAVLEADEAWMVWKWLNQSGVEIIDSTRPLALPARPVKPLAAAS
jgi:DNA polymerase-3 subunit epsilon